MTGMAYVVQYFLVCSQLPRNAVDPGLGLLNGALCSDCDVASEDVEVMASGKASITHDTFKETSPGNDADIYAATYGAGGDRKVGI
eukprot:364183-Chlamydomonas_euryale.AAC.2